MTKRLPNATYYDVRSENGNDYGVTIERVQNDRNGNPRFKAGLIIARCNLVMYYTFTGHYMKERDEAQWIVDYHERNAL